MASFSSQGGIHQRNVATTRTGSQANGAAGFGCGQITVNGAGYGAGSLTLVITCRDIEEASRLNQAIQQNILSCCDLDGAWAFEFSKGGHFRFILSALGKGSLNGDFAGGVDCNDAAATGGGNPAAQADILPCNDFNPVLRPDRF